MAFELRAALAVRPICTLSRLILDELDGLGDPEVVAWRSSLVPHDFMPGDLDELCAHMSAAGPTLLGVELELAGGAVVFLSREEECVFAAVTVPCEGQSSGPELRSLTGRLVEAGLVETAIVGRVDDPFEGELTDLPLVRRMGVLVVVDAGMIERHVGPVDDVLALPWDEYERMGRLHALSRGLDLVDSNDFIQHVMPHHASLASLVARRGMLAGVA